MMEEEEGPEGWTVEGELGRGSFGSVYLLVHRHGGPSPTLQKYALKIIDEHGARKGDREEARKELRIMRGLFHPHIVDLVDAFELQQQIHLVLELCDGGDLRTYLDQLRKRRAKEKRPTTGVEETLVLTWTKQLASALTYLHHKKILHRDLKPQNIFLKDRYNLKVGDLGIARQLRFTLEMAATHIGTPLYISPEIYQGTPYSYKSDVWSLGCCVYEMMALQCAFQAASRYEVMWKVVSKDLGPVPQCYSVELRALTISMLNKDPEDRPSASEVHDVVQSVLQQQERPPWEARTKQDMSPTRPADTKSLQMWRQDMANALIKYLSERHAIHSAGLAELAIRLSRGSIEGSDEDFTTTISAQPHTKGSRSSRDTHDSVTDRYSTDSYTGSDSETDVTVTLTKAEGASASQSDVSEAGDASSAQNMQLTRAVLRRSAFKVKHNESPDVKRKKAKDGVSERSGRAHRKRRERGVDSDHSESSLSHGYVHHREREGDAAESLLDNSDVTSTTRHPADMHNRFHDKAQIGKLSGLKPRPLPVPNNSAGYLDDTDNPPMHSSVLRPLSERTSAAPPSDSLSLPLFIDVSSDAKSEHFFPDEREAQAAYAKEVADRVRYHLFSAEQGEGVPVQGSPCTGGGANDFHSPVEDVAGEGAGREESEQEPTKGERAKRKKKNFLKERTSKQQNGKTTYPDTEPASEDKPVKGVPEAEGSGITLFTRSQRVCFTNSRDSASPPPEEELEIVNKRHSVTRMRMAIELGEDTFQAALSTAQLLKDNPSLLEVQLKDLLGRENYKKFAAAIVDCADRTKEAS